MSKEFSGAPATTLPGLLRLRSAKSALSNKMGLSSSLTETLGSIGLGILIVGGGAVGIGAGFNYAQDSSAQGVLESVKSAQTMWQSKNNTFGQVSDLTAGNPAPLNGNLDGLTIASNATDYCAVVKSGSMFGTEYWLTARSGKILNAAPTVADAGVTCPTI